MTDRPIASRESILEYADFNTRYVDVPEWGGMRVKIRSMTADERDELEAPMVEAAAANQNIKFGNFRARLVALVCINEDGTRMFTLEDSIALGKKHNAAISRLADAAIELSRISEADADALGKDLSETPDSDSGTSSPEHSG